jgi:hypothetical protein
LRFSCCPASGFLLLLSHLFVLLIPLLIVSDKPITFINTWKCYFALKPIHTIALTNLLPHVNHKNQVLKGLDFSRAAHAVLGGI